MSRADRRAVIVGGGIGGHVAALALQAAGWTPEIHEARSAGAPVTQGVFLTLAVNGFAALDRVGAGDAVRRLGFPTGRIRFDSAAGKSLGSVPIGPEMSDGYGTRTVRRSELLATLAALTAERGIPTIHGRRFTGTPWDADLLVGADGLHSAVRAWIDPAAPVPRYTGIGNAGGFARLASAAIDADPRLAAALAGGGDYRMLWGRRAFFGWTVAPDGEVWWFANPPARAPRDREALRRLAPDERRAEVAALFADDTPPAAQIVAATDGEILLENGYDLPKLRTWHRAGAVLIGDAAHAVSPATGQGASLAIEDAVTLAACVRAVPRQGSPGADRVLAAALDDYVALRRDRVERVAAWGRRVGNTKTGGPVKRRFMEFAMPKFLAAGSSPKAMAKQAWLFDHEVPSPAARVAVAHD